jgi:hypothetical protein
MENLCDLLSGVKINNQHIYFELAKTDIAKLAYQYANYKEYDNSVLNLILNIKLLEPDLYQLNIVIQYVITYGSSFFRVCLSHMKINSYNNRDVDHYIDNYIEDLSSFIK